jgi:hypothetical protein
MAEKKRHCIEKDARHEWHSVKAAFRDLHDARSSTFSCGDASLIRHLAQLYTSPERAAEYSPGMPSLGECFPGSAYSDREANPWHRHIQHPPAASSKSSATRRESRQSQKTRPPSLNCVPFMPGIWCGASVTGTERKNPVNEFSRSSVPNAADSSANRKRSAVAIMVEVRRRVA